MNVFDLVASITLDRSQYNESLGDAKKDFDGFGSKLKKGLGTAAKIGGAAVAAFSAAAVAIGKQSIESYAQYEQLVGGVETLFGAQGKSLGEYAASVGKTANEAKAEYDNLIAAQTTVVDNANNAYKTMGLSANEYMETVTGFAAALNQSLGGNTKKAAEYADRAITDMADNASKMGTSMESIQAAYSGFSKQNYTMLDNLKLGYGGTKTEMERLIKDAENLDSSFKATRDANGDLTMSYADIVDAIHIVQDNMGIAGNAAAEASKTISGSLSAAKAAYKNLITGLADDSADIDTLLDNFTDSVLTAGENLLPRIEKVLGSLARIVPKAIDKVFPIINRVIQENLPTLIRGGTQLLASLIAGIAQALPMLVEMVPEIVKTIGTTLQQNWPAIKEAGGELLQVLWEGIQGAGVWLWENIKLIWEQVKLDAADYWNAIKDNIGQVWDNIKSTVSEKIENIKKSISDTWESIKTTVTTKIDTLKTNISTRFENIRKKIKEVIDKIKGIFDFEWSLPKIKVPHIKFNNFGTPPYGIAGLGEPPDIDIVWNKKAYDQPYVFNKPTVAGFGDGVGGEMVYGKENLMQDIRDAVGDMETNVTINIYNAQNLNESEVAKRIEKIFVDRARQRRLLNA